MNTLAAARSEIKTVLDTAGYTVKTYIPERVAPPLIILEPGDPYMTEGNTFTSFTVRFNLLLLAGPWTNAKASDDLDQMVMDVVDALDMYFIDKVEQPQMFEANNVSYLGTRINISDQKEINT